MSQILALLYSLVDGKSSAHTYLGAVGLFGIARKQAATAHVVTAVSVATGAVPPAPAPK